MHYISCIILVTHNAAYDIKMLVFIMLSAVQSAIFRGETWVSQLLPSSLLALDSIENSHR